MTTTTIGPPDPRLDLVLERTVDVRPELVWEAWTKPEHVKHWFVPPLVHHRLPRSPSSRGSSRSSRPRAARATPP